MKDILEIREIYKWDKENPYDKIELFNSTGYYDEYPMCKKIFEVNNELLAKEFYKVRSALEDQTGTYLKRWFEQRDVDWQVAKQELDAVNFTAEYYRQYNLMDLDPETNQWTQIYDWVGPYTKEILNKFQSKVVRARYSIAQPNWFLKLHVDYPNPKDNGFRIHIPIITSRDVKTMFLKNDMLEEIYFEPGYVWFMNVSYPHKIEHSGNNERIYLTLDLWDDLDVTRES